MNLEKDTWKIIDIYFRDNKNYLTKHQLDSFNNFITKQIPETIQQNNPVRILKDQQGKNGIYKKRIDIYFGGLDSNNIYQYLNNVYHEYLYLNNHLFYILV